MKDNSKIVFIGAGNMAEALVRGVLSAGVCKPENLCVTDVQPERLAYFKEQLNVDGQADNAVAVQHADVVVLAVKPQVAGEVIDTFREAFSEDAVLISILAGVTTKRLEELLGGTARVVRVMPNTPALVGAGASALSGGRNAQEYDLVAAEEILGAAGLCVRLDEEHLDAVTALSGSGPAYVFRMIEALVEGGLKLNLPEDVARKLAVQTVLGSAKLCEDSGEDPALLRQRVTSPGGTTEAALRTMEASGFAEALIRGMGSACNRSRELSQGK